MNITKIATAVIVAAVATVGITSYRRLATTAREQSAVAQRLAQGLEEIKAENQRLAAANRSDADEIAVLKSQLAARTVAPLAPNAAAANAATAPAPHPLATGLKPIENFARATRDTPRATLESLDWAAAGGNVAAVSDLLTFPAETRQKAEKLFANLPDATRAQYGTPEQLLATLVTATTAVAGMQVLSERPGAHAVGFDAALADDSSYRTLHTQTQYSDGRVRENDVVLQQGSGGWNVVFPPWLVDKTAEMLKPRPANFKHDGGG
jgi:hypothetical protein